MWIRDPRCGGVIKKAWDSTTIGSPSYILCHKQLKTTSALKRWNMDFVGYTYTKIKELTGQIEEIQKLDRTKLNSKLEANLQSDLNE